MPDNTHRSGHSAPVGCREGEWTLTSIAVLACGLTLFFACGESSQSKRAGSDAPSVAVEATPVSSLSSLSTSIAATLPDATTSISSVPATSAPDVTVLLDSGDLVPQLVGQTYVFNVDDLNSGSLSRLGSVVMPDGTQLTSESSVGVGAALMVISIPDRGSIVLLTVPGAPSYRRHRTLLIRWSMVSRSCSVTESGY